MLFRSPPAAVPSLDAMAAQGIDTMGLWLALGRELADRATRAAAEADAAVTAADSEVAAARAMLSEAEHAAADARRAAQKAHAEADEIRRRLGGAA